MAFTVQHIAAGVLLGASIAAQALSEDADKPMQISADEVVYEQKVDTVTYRGNVRINQGTLKIIAHQVTAELEDDRVVRLTATGEPAYYSQQLKADQARMQADARTIVYHTQDELVDLKGNAHLTQEGNDFRGELIKYNIRAGRVDASSSKPERIRMTLQPKRRDNADSSDQKQQ